MKFDTFSQVVSQLEMEFKIDSNIIKKSTLEEDLNFYNQIPNLSKNFDLQQNYSNIFKIIKHTSTVFKCLNIIKMKVLILSPVHPLIHLTGIDFGRKKAPPRYANFRYQWKEQ